MKSTLSLIGLVYLLGMCASSAQTSLSAEQLEIGYSGADQVASGVRRSGAIGTDNEVHEDQSLAVGDSNIIKAPEALAVGRGNKIGISTYTYDGNASIAVGLANWVYGAHSVAIGRSNYLEDGDEEWDGTEYSLAVGQSNTMRGTHSAIVGMYNVIDEDYDYGLPLGTVVLGRGLISRWSNCTVVGKYNNASLAVNSGLLFAVGNGSSSATDGRSNAFEVFYDGTVKMPIQGDILMGEFGSESDATP